MICPLSLMLHASIRVKPEVPETSVLRSPGRLRARGRATWIICVQRHAGHPTRIVDSKTDTENVATNRRKILHFSGLLLPQKTMECGIPT